ncbi:hypothetical protein [Streptomyces sp. NPDC029674]|uniref:hypothetical protein n=1 Tax=Streptomyces sp. NPDC029674 TaxID=3365297 RepID=UPI00384DFD44
MSDWGIALIAAGSAVLGSITTGWFTRSAGIHSVQATLNDQRIARTLDRRRQTYARFLEAAQIIDQHSGGNAEQVAELNHAMAMVLLEGPSEVSGPMSEYYLALSAVLNGAEPPDLRDRHMEFIQAAKAALPDYRFGGDLTPHG